MRKLGPVFKTLNALGGAACVLIGVMLAQLDFIFVHQSPGDDAFTLIQAHWVAVGAISLIVAASKRFARFWIALLLVWIMLNGWLGGKALLVADPNFLWVLVFPVLAVVNYAQLLAQDESGDSDEAQIENQEHESAIPADFYEVRSPSPAAAVHGVLQIILLVALQIGLLVFFFFYGELMVRVIFDGASVEFARVLNVLGGAFVKILYIPVIIVVVYSIVFLGQLIIEKMAVGGRTAEADDVNRALSLQERNFIETHLHEIDDYISEAKFPAFYGWLYWPSIFGMIGFFIGLPVLIVFLEAIFFNAIEVSGIPEDTVISSLGPAYVGGVIFSFLFGATFYWAGFQWLGARYRRVGEYLHMRWGWNSMNAEPRPLAAYAKIFTRFVRKRRYSPEHRVSAQQFIHDAYDEFSGFLYKSTVVLGIATVLFTALDVNWRRIVHTEGLHYSPYLDFRSFDLSLDDISRVELRCFLYGENDEGDRNPGVGYDVVFSNSMRANLFDPELSAALLDKVETIDGGLILRETPTSRAERAGAVFLRSIDGFWPDCRETVLPKLESGVRDRVGGLLRIQSGESPPEN